MTAEQDLERDEFVACRVERDRAVCRVPEMVGGQVALGLRRDQFAGHRVDLVQLVDDGDLAYRRLCGNAAAVWVRSEPGACLGWGRGAGTRLETVTLGRRRRPAIAGPVDGLHGELDGRSGGKFQVTEMHLDPLARPGRPAGSARAAVRGHRASRRTRGSRPGRRLGA